MIAILLLLACIGGAFAAALWGLWQLVTAPRTVCNVCREPTRGAELADGLCWVCQRNVALLVPDAPPTPHREVPLPAWLERAVNEAAG